MRLSYLLLCLVRWHTCDAFIDCQNASTAGVDQRLHETCRLLLQNYERFDVNFGPRHYDNHVSYFVIALFRMGASGQRIREAYTYEVKELDPAIPSQHVVNASTWRRYLRQGSYYKDYVEFIVSEVHAHGLEKVLNLYAPVALQGLTGGLLHPLIQFGYGYELNDTNAISQGIAWLLSHGSVFPKLNPHPKYSYADAETILEAMRKDRRLPDGNITLELLQTKYADALSEYDIELPDGDTAVEIPWAFENLAIKIFGTTHDNFFLLHLSTGSRAMSRVMRHTRDAAVRAAALQQLWKGIVYVYALEGRPAVRPPRAGPLRPWPELVKAALPINDSHFQKMVYLCIENYKLGNDHIWWSVAENVITLFETGGGWIFHSLGHLGDPWPGHHGGHVRHEFPRVREVDVILS